LKKYFIYLFLLILFISAKPGFCQVTADIDYISVAQAIKQVEERYGVKVFYLEEWFDGIDFIGEMPGVTAVEDVAYILRNTGYRCIAYSRDYLVVLKKGSQLEQERILALAEYRVYDPDKILTLSGSVISEKEEEMVIGATVYIEELDTGTITNANGNFRIEIPSGKYHILVNSVGLLEEDREIELLSDTQIQVSMASEVVELSEVVIREDVEDANISDVYVGITKLDIQTIKNMPAFMGEVDVVRSLLMLPGVSSVGEASTGFNVRGGSVDQNLILLDETPVFNTSHLFGLFSVFNQDAIDNVTLLRGGIPARYGGRLSSVLDIRSNEHQAETLEMKGGIGLVSSRLTVDVPIVKEKMSVMLGGRYSYTDLVLNLFASDEVKGSSAYFYDANLKYNYQINKKNTLQMSFYTSYDQFKFPTDTVNEWGTRNASIRYNRLFGKKLVMNIVGAYSDYDYGIFDPEGSDSFNWEAGIDYKNLKADFTYFLGEKHRLEFGGGVVWYTLYPGKLTSGEGSSINPDELEPENSRESAVYISDEYALSKRITLYAGLRYSYYSIFGPKTINLYADGLPRNEENVIGERTYEEGETIKTFDGWEPRLSLRFGINDKSSVKLSFNRMYQYIHLISNTISISPIDIWKSSDYHIGPQFSDQFSIGYFRNFMSNTIESSLEFYYKNIYDLVDFKDGAELFLNPNLENALLQGEGRAYGVELMINKTLGRLTGWVSYAYSRTERKIEGPFEEETINNGYYYPANYDKPHDIKISGTYKRDRIRFRRTLAKDSDQGFTGRVTEAEDGTLQISGRFAANTRGVWSAECKPAQYQGTTATHQKSKLYDVILTDVGDNKIGVIKAVREVTQLGLKDAKYAVENTPYTVKAGVSAEYAIRLANKLQEAGAVVKIEKAN